METICVENRPQLFVIVCDETPNYSISDYEESNTSQSVENQSIETPIETGTASITPTRRKRKRCTKSTLVGISEDGVPIYSRSKRNRSE